MSPVLPEQRADNIPARVALSLIRTGTVTLSKETLAARGEGLPALQASLLIRIYSSPRDECTVGALAESMGLTPPTISDSLKALVRKGLVDRRRSAKDGRVVFFNTTHRGRDVARRLGQWARPVERSIAEMSRDDQRELMKFLTKILRDRVEEGIPIPEAMCVSCSNFEMASWKDGVYRCTRMETKMDPFGLKTDCPQHVPLSITGS
ncbi:MAG: MarR family winged helix-turn-helix transcriptional regulator [bacterium]